MCWVTRFEEWIAGAVEFVPFRRNRAQYPMIDPARFDRTIHMIEPDGSIVTGAHAIARALGRGPGLSWVLGLYYSLPPLEALADAVYDFVASHRRSLAFLTPCWWRGIRE